MSPRLLLAFFAIGALASRLVGQQADRPVYYETTLQAAFVTAYCAGGGYFQITDENGTMITGGAGSGSGGMAQAVGWGGFVKVKLTPNKEYTVTTGSAGVANLGNPPGPQMRYAYIQVHFSSSVNVYVNGNLTRSVQMPGTSTSSFKFRVGSPGGFPLEGAPSYLRGGDCSSLVNDKPIWYLGLGRLRNGDAAGSVGFRKGEFSPALYTPAALAYTSPDPAEVDVIQQSGAIRQIFSREVLVDVQTISSDSYRLDVYARASVGTLSGGLYPINSGQQPFVKYTVEKVTVGSDEGIKITREEDGKSWYTSLIGNATERVYQGWKLSSETKVRSVKTEYTSSTDTEITHTGPLSNGSGQASPFTHTKSYTDYGGTWGKELTSRSLAPTSSSPLTSFYTYYTTTNTSDNSFERSLKTEIDASGRWSRYEYYAASSSIGAAGSIKRIYRPWLDDHDNPDTASTSNSAWEERTYYNGYWNLPASIVTTAPNGNVLSKSTWAYNLTPGIVNGEYYYVADQKDFWGVGSSDYLTTTIKKFRWDSGTLLLRDKPISVSYPTGRKEAWAYFNGTWDDSSKQFTATASGGARQVLKFNGQSGGGTALSSWSQNGQSRTLDSLHMVGLVSTVTEEITDERGHLVLSATYVYTSSGTLSRLSGVHHSYDTHGRPSEEVDLVRSTGSDAYKTSRTYEGSAVAEETGVDGVVTKYELNGFLGLEKKTTGLDGGTKYPAKVEEFIYDPAGRLEKAYTCACSTGATIYTYDDAGRIESASEGSPNTGNLTTTYTYPDPLTTDVESPSGALKVTGVYLDGRTKSVTGSGTKPVYYSFSAEADGVRVTVTHAGANDKSLGWEEIKYDLLGRPVESVKPKWGWSSTGGADAKRLVTETIYDNSTGLISKVKLKDNETSEYPVPNTLYFHAYGRLTAEGFDLDGDNTLDVGENDRFVSYGRQYVPESGAWFMESTKTSYLESSSSTATEIQKDKIRLTGFSTVTGEIVDSESEVTDAAGQTTSVREYVNPGEKSRTRETSVTGASNKSYIRYENGYLADSTSFSDVSEKREYDSKGRLQYIYGRLSGTAYQTSKSYTYYGDTAYPNIVTDQGVPTTYSYSWGTTGENTVTETDAASNVRHTQYNALGLVSRIWGNAANPAEYSYDGLGRRVGLTTWRGGSFSGTTWPSETGGAQTQWDLEPATGLLREKTHADGNKWTYTYTSLGQPATRLWARSVSSSRVTTTYGYYDGTEGSGHVSYKTQQLKSVSYSDGVTSSLGYTYKRSGALAGVSDATGSRSFSYLADGRLDSEALSAFFGSRSIAQTYSGAMVTGFEVRLSSTVEGGMYASFNTATGRVSSLDGLGSLPTFTPGYLTGSDWVESWTSGLYTRSQNLAAARDVVKQATTSWNGTVMASFDTTQFNSRGLRETTTQSGSMTSPGSTTLGYNARYELTSSNESNGIAKDFTWNYDLIGKRTSATEAGATTTYTSVSTASLDVNQYDSVTGNNAESGIDYDVDGNLTVDGTWTYAYDAENRLISMTNRHISQALQFTYDYMGRRVRKVVTGTGAGTTTYVWSGWKLIEELDGSGNLARSYVWGADFSSAAGAAGGAGGLLAVNHNGTTYFPSYDNHGNIIGYLNASGGVAATYEYNSFGEIIGVSGSSADFTFGYATQVTDRETGLVYYGLRYYNPKHGKFINRDPIGENGGINLYAFVSNAVGNAWDILGLRRYCWVQDVSDPNYWVNTCTGEVHSHPPDGSEPDYDDDYHGPGFDFDPVPGSGGAGGGPGGSDEPLAKESLANLDKAMRCAEVKRQLAANQQARSSAHKGVASQANMLNSYVEGSRWFSVGTIFNSEENILTDAFQGVSVDAGEFVFGMFNGPAPAIYSVVGSGGRNIISGGVDYFNGDEWGTWDGISNSVAGMYGGTSALFAGAIETSPYFMPKPSGYSGGSASRGLNSLSHRGVQAIGRGNALLAVGSLGISVYKNFAPAYHEAVLRDATVARLNGQLSKAQDRYNMSEMVDKFLTEQLKAMGCD